MTALPAATGFTGSGITEAQFKTAMIDLRGYLSGLLGTDGNPVTALAALDALFAAGVDAKSGAYSLAAGDRGKLLDCTGTWTLSLLAAATAGAGYAAAVRNSGSGTITIDPGSTEQIDGASTLYVTAGASAILVCTGTAWVSVGLSEPITYPVSIAQGGTGETSASAARGALAAVGDDNGVGVGSFALLIRDDAGQSVSSNYTYSGGSISYACLYLDSGSPTMQGYVGADVSGTWRAMHSCTGRAGAKPIFLAQRIA